MWLWIGGGVVLGALLLRRVLRPPVGRDLGNVSTEWLASQRVRRTSED